MNFGVIAPICAVLPAGLLPPLGRENLIWAAMATETVRKHLLACRGRYWTYWCSINRGLSLGAIRAADLQRRLDAEGRNYCLIENVVFVTLFLMGQGQTWVMVEIQHQNPRDTGERSYEIPLLSYVFSNCWERHVASIKGAIPSEIFE